MNLSAPFIKRPIATTLLAFAVAIAGAVAFKLMPVSSLPQIEFPTIMVQAVLPGASPEVMASSVATPLERQLGWISGITEMTSTSTTNVTRIVILFDLSRNIEGAARDVQAAINAARDQLPANLPNNPIYRKVNPADAPIMVLALTSDHYSQGQLYDVASTILQQRLSQVEGIGQVIVGGSSLPAVRIELNPTALNQYGISLDTVRNVIATTNVNRPKGQLMNGNTSAEIIMNDQLFKAYEYQPLVIAYQNGKAVRLSEVAEVKDSVEDLRNLGVINGKSGIAIILFKQPGANVIKTIDYIRQIFPQLKAAIPAAMNLNVTMDLTTTIRASFHEVEMTLLLAIVLVMMVVFLFFSDLATLLVSSVVVPLSLLGTFGIMKLLGFSLNNLSLMALTISTGFVIDDAVVVLENIIRYLERGVKPVQAALEGAKEVGFTVLSMSVSLTAVFIPILFMGGITGRILHEFSVTLVVAVLVSLVVSLTVTPMMCAQFLKIKGQVPEPLTLYRRLLKQLFTYYEKTLQWALQHSRLMLGITLAAIVLNIFLFIYIPKGFIPQQDTGRLVASIMGDQNISFQAMKQKFIKYVEIIKQNPAVENVAGFVGGGVTNAGNMFISLKPLAERKVSADTVINQLRDQLSVVTGADLYMQSSQDIVTTGRRSNAQYQYTWTADNLDDLNYWMPRLREVLSKTPGIADVSNDQLSHRLQLLIDVDRDTAARFGITTQQIDKILYDAFGQSPVSTIYTSKNQYRVIMEVAPRYWQRPETLNNIYVFSAMGKAVPLSAFARFKLKPALLSVNHQGQSPAATLAFNLLPNVALGEAVRQIDNVFKQINLPVTMKGGFGGAAKMFKSTTNQGGYLILIAIVTVYIVLGILYESLIHPITILSTLPSAGLGAFLALLLTGTEFSIVSLIGIILLVGVVKKNAIMMIDFAIRIERIDNKSPRDAIYEAALLRFRPIMMTTIAAIFCALPLVFNYGVGAELRRPLGITIMGGLIVSQMLTLYTTPVIYLALERLSHRFDYFIFFRKRFFTMRS